MSSRFEQSKALERQTKNTERVAKYQERQARNLARYSIRQANKGNLDTPVRIKTTGRFRLAPVLGETPSNKVLDTANQLLSEGGLSIRRGYHDDLSPNGRMVITSGSQPNRAFKYEG